MNDAPDSSTTTQVASSATVKDIALANPARMGLTIYNASTAILFLKLGSAAAADSYTLQIAAGGYYEVPYRYTGIITGYWASANGFAYVTDILP